MSTSCPTLWWRSAEIRAPTPARPDNGAMCCEFRQTLRASANMRSGEVEQTSANWWTFRPHCGKMSDADTGIQLQSSDSPVPVARATGTAIVWCWASERRQCTGNRQLLPLLRSYSWHSGLPVAVATGTGLSPLCGWRPSNHIVVATQRVHSSGQAVRPPGQARWR